MDYSSSGVDICRADQMVDWLKTLSSPHHKERILSGVGGFASVCQIQFPNMTEPCLASSTDGVGTKLKLALQYQSLKSLGQDLVAMCVNDLLCVGADPLFFMDYYACGKLEKHSAQEFIEGIQQACVQAGCSLIGGETAEMPGLYKGQDFDCAGFALGIVDRKDIIGASRVKKGDCLLALPSDGFHSNGYSLLRKIFSPDLDEWSDFLLKPTVLYTKVFSQVLKNKIHALAHITGGGINNILRSVPKGSLIRLEPWSIPQCFLEVRKRANIDFKQLLTTLNCGLGMVVFVDSKSVNSLLKDLEDFEIKGFYLGKISEIDSSQNSRWELDFQKWEN